MKQRISRSGFYIDVRTSSAAVLSVVERILHLELLNAIRSGDGNPCGTKRSDLCEVGSVTVRIPAVQHEVVIAAARPIGSDLLASRSQLGGVHDIGVRAGRPAQNLGVIAIDQG